VTPEHSRPLTEAPLWKRVAQGLGFPARTENPPGAAPRLGWPHVGHGVASPADPTMTDDDRAASEGEVGSPDSPAADISTELSTSSSTADETETMTSPESDHDVSRETVDATEEAVTAAVSVASTASTPDVSRETPPVLDDTPLMRAVVQETRQKQALDSRRFPRPDHTRILTVANQKGGVGKTTTTVNIAAALALAGLSVLVVDLDPQGNASTALGVPHHSEVTSIYDVLVDGTPLAEIIQLCPDIEGLLCAPATIDLAGSEIELVSLVARETRLRRALSVYLQEREERIDYVLIDCPPSLGLLTVNAFVAADEVFIPIQCEYYALEGLSQLLKNIELIRTHLNPDLHVSTILLTMYDARTRLSAQVAEEVRTHFGGETLRSTVPRSVRVSEAPSHGQTVITYDPMSTGALAYREAAAEIADRGVSASVDVERAPVGHSDEPAPKHEAVAAAAPLTSTTPDREDTQ